LWGEVVIEAYGEDGANGEPQSRGIPGLSSNIIVVVILLLIVSIPAWAPLVLGVKQPLAIVDGRSMEPTLHTGDLVILHKVPPGDIHVGDIIIYRSTGGRYVIHRVVKVYKNNGEECYVTWGDNRYTNPIPDAGFPVSCPPTTVRDPVTGRALRATGIPYSAVIGKVISVSGITIKIPYIGGLSLIFK